MKGLQHRMDVRIVAFPCNQFGEQEPGSAQEIREFVRGKGVGVNAPDSNVILLERGDVNGADAHELYCYLKRASGQSDDIKWNFSAKFLVQASHDVYGGRQWSVMRVDRNPMISELLKQFPHEEP